MHDSRYGSGHIGHGRILRSSRAVPLPPERAGGDKARGIDFIVDALARGTETHAPIHADLLTKSIVLGVVEHKVGSYLLPRAYREGSPMYPFYPAARPTIAGACGTMPKAFFDEMGVVPNPTVARADGRSLDPYTGAVLTVGGELNKPVPAKVHYDANGQIQVNASPTLSALCTMLGAH